MDDDDILESLAPSGRKALRKVISKARTRTHMQVLEKLTDLVDDKYLLKVNAPFLTWRETHSQKGHSD